MGRCARGWWLGLGVLLGCGPAPSEVVEVYQGQSSSGSDASGGSGGSGGTAPDGTGPVADASGGSGTSAPEPTSDANTTVPVDPSTSGPGSTGDPPPESTGPASTGDTPGSNSSDGGMPLSCDDIFGAAPSYVLCSFDDGSCSFNVSTGGQSCTQICATYGEACIHALDNPSSQAEACVVQGDSFCDNNTKASTICVCTR